MITRVLGIAALFLGALLGTSSVAQAQRGGGRDSIECRSENYRYARCDAGWRDARLVRQLSGSSCVRGQTWGIDRRGSIWVDRGCSGVFVEAGGGGGGHGGGGGGGWNPGPDWDRDISFVCRSSDYRYNMCQVDVGRGGEVRLVRQISSTRCVQGRTWGYNRAGVWVDQGCAAEFVVERRWR
ncbi:hypothetical protein DFR29_101291 [Tahibacter aquaticus]|uniref:DUF3011 family protein n=1 Tax=Tahibacter aquaticus TaxID=520092 RepID=A0A4R6Z9R5_9GAMM|nr:DUF3011 domain-containing protein [Tahibacter aquaticus]TDR48668.1 hypothetical protein DFR29_101291 [Tahibacter aquaticus]